MINYRNCLWTFFLSFQHPNDQNDNDQYQPEPPLFENFASTSGSTTFTNIIKLACIDLVTADGNRYVLCDITFHCQHISAVAAVDYIRDLDIATSDYNTFTPTR